MVALLLWLSIALPARAAEGIAVCSSSYQQLSARTPLSDLNPLVARWLKLFRRVARPGSDLPASVRAGNTHYAVQAELGSGREAHLYLVEAKDRRVVAKVYHSQVQCRDAITTHSRYADWLPKILSVDCEARTLILAYRSGIPISELEEAAPSLGLSPGEVEDIIGRYRIWRKRAQPQTEVGFYPSLPFDAVNVVYDFDLDEFFLIDAL